MAAVLGVAMDRGVAARAPGLAASIRRGIRSVLRIFFRKFDLKHHVQCAAGLIQASREFG